LTPCVSVVIPTYNHRDLVLETLGSVFAQTFTDYEVVVVNDGSPDDTGLVLRPLIDAGKIKYIEQPNAGQAAARNRGLAAAAGRYIAFLDDDDIWPSDKLESQVSLLSSSPQYPLVFGRSMVLGDTVLAGAATEDRAYAWGDFCEHNPILSPGQVLFQEKTLRDAGGFDTKIWGADDWDLYLRLVARSAFLGSSKVALHYRWHEGNASRDSRRMRKNELKVLRRHFAAPGSRGSLMQWLRHRRRYAEHYARVFSHSGFPRLALYEASLFSVLNGFRSLAVGRRTCRTLLNRRNLAK
jgi:glycosyltransferase involved in cell wall biosynthesis